MQLMRNHPNPLRPLLLAATATITEKTSQAKNISIYRNPLLSWGDREQRR